MLQFIEDIPIQTGKTVIIKPPMRISALYLETDNSAVADADAINDIGDLTINFQSKSIVSCDLAVFNDITNVFKGKPTWSKGGAGSYGGAYSTIDIAVLIPFSFPNVPNALNLDGMTAMNLVWRPNKAYAGTLSIYGVKSHQRENFIPYLLKVPETGNGRITMHSPMYNTYLAFVTPRNSADMVSVEKDKEAWLQAYANELLRLSEINARIESGSLSSFILDFADTGVVADILSDNVQIHVEHGAAGTSTTYFYCLDFVAKRLAKDIAIKSVEYSTKIAKITQIQPEIKEIAAITKKPLALI